MNTEITKALASLNQSLELFNLPDEQFQTGGAITKACRIAGYNESGTSTVNSLNAWSSTVAEFAEMLAK